jgi:hypothetical protein
VDLLSGEEKSLTAESVDLVLPACEVMVLKF